MEENEIIKPATLHKEFSALKAMLNKALAFDEIEKNFEKFPTSKFTTPERELYLKKNFSL